MPIVNGSTAPDRCATKTGDLVQQNGDSANVWLVMPDGRWVSLQTATYSRPGILGHDRLSYRILAPGEKVTLEVQ